MKVVLFIGSLNTGGAERQISLLAKGLAERGHEVTVITLFPGGQIASDLKNTPALKLQSLWANKSRYLIVRVIQLVAAPLRLRKLIWVTDCLYSMLEITNFIAWLATRFNKNIRLVWGIRSTNVEGHRKMVLFDKLCSLVSPTVELIIANSHTGLECLKERGYRCKKNVVIPNGIDTERFQIDEDSRRKLRNELGVTNSQHLIGIVGRLDPMKDHPNFLKAARLISNLDGDVKFLCVGGGRDDYAQELHMFAKKLGLKNRVIWLGDQSDMVAIYSALDILVSSSAYGEGFSNVVGEAMSCGVPCVVTDVGDSARVVGDSGSVVERRKPEKLGNAICNILEGNAGSDLAIKSRIRIEENFSIEKLIDTTEQSLIGDYAVE